MKNRVIAFYLPQFHSIPENDKAHGEGFTEWTNTKKAKPLFEGHRQPRTPLGENYYNLLDKGVMADQIKMAKEYGIYGFCYYHYWFKNGKKLLEKPVENMLADKSLDMPFCICWANENWTRRWDGGNNEIIVEQDYGDIQDLKNHVDYLCQFFKDERYIRIHGRPLLLIYKPELIPNLRKVVRIIREQAKHNGIPELNIAVQFSRYYVDGANLGIFDSYIQFQPKFVQDNEDAESKNPLRRKMKKIFLTVDPDGKILGKFRKFRSAKAAPSLTHRSYDEDWKKILRYEVKDKRLIAGAFVDWDNTARNKNGLVYDDVTPQKFGKYMKQLVKKVNSEYKTPHIFINAWNEWAEGTYLEPDEDNGYAYLEALRDALKGEND